MNYIDMKMNEDDLINMFNKKELKELLEVQIKYENYEGAQVIKNAIEQYDYCVVPLPNDIDFNSEIPL